MYNENYVIFKGTKDGVTVIFDPEVSFETLCTQLEKKVAEAGFPRWRWGEKRFPVMGFSLRKTAQPPKVCCLDWKRMARISWLTVR